MTENQFIKRPNSISSFESQSHLTCFFFFLGLWEEIQQLLLLQHQFISQKHCGNYLKAKNVSETTITFLMNQEFLTGGQATNKKSQIYHWHCILFTVLKLFFFLQSEKNNFLI